MDAGDLNPLRVASSLGVKHEPPNKSESKPAHGTPPWFCLEALAWVPALTVLSDGDCSQWWTITKTINPKDPFLPTLLLVRVLYHTRYNERVMGSPLSWMDECFGIGRWLHISGVESFERQHLGSLLFSVSLPRPSHSCAFYYGMQKQEALSWPHPLGLPSL